MFKKMRFVRLMVGIGLFGALGVPGVRAEIGLQNIFSTEGVVAVGQAVQSAVEAIYSSTAGPADIQEQIVDVLNEAATTGEDQVVRYTIVAVMLAGGSDHLDLSKQAIDNSDVLKNFPDTTAFTVTAAKAMLSASDAKKSGGGEQAGGGEAGGATAGEEKGGEADGATADEEKGGEAGGAAAGEEGGGEAGGAAAGEGGGGGVGGDEFGGGYSTNPFDGENGADIIDKDIPGTPT